MGAKKREIKTNVGLAKASPKREKSGGKNRSVVGRAIKSGKTLSRVAVQAVSNKPSLVSVNLDDAGRIVVPAKFRKSLGIEPGDPLTVTLDNNGLHVHTLKTTLEKVRALNRKKNPKKRSLVKELIAERRAEAKKE